MNCIQRFTSAVAEKCDREWREEVERLTAQAENQKPFVLSFIAKNFPLFFSNCQVELEKATTGFLNNGRKDVGLSGFGAPGVVVEGLILAIHRNSKCEVLIIAKYNGEGVAETLGTVGSGELRADKKLAAILLKECEE